MRVYDLASSSASAGVSSVEDYPLPLGDKQALDMGTSAAVVDKIQSLNARWLDTSLMNAITALLYL